MARSPGGLGTNYVSSLDPREALESGDYCFVDRSPTRMGRSRGGQGKTSFRWTPQQPSKVATVSQIAAP
eukprot:7738063-Pyramimonas_sp.AAC.1